MLLRCLFNVKTAQYVKCDGIHVGTLQGPAVMDKQCSKRKRQIIVSLRTASVPLIFTSTHSVKTSLTLHDTNPLSRRLTVHFRASDWQEAVGDWCGNQCRNILWQFVHCNMEQVSANLRQIHQSTAPDADDNKDRGVGRLILWMWCHSATRKCPPTQFQRENFSLSICGSIEIQLQHLSVISSH